MPFRGHKQRKDKTLQHALSFQGSPKASIPPGRPLTYWGLLTQKVFNIVAKFVLYDEVAIALSATDSGSSSNENQR